MYILTQPAPSPSPSPAYPPVEGSWVFVAEDAQEVLRFGPDGSVYLRGKLVGKDQGIARIVKNQIRTRK